MEKKEFNPIIKAVQSLRRIATEIRVENSKILEYDADIMKMLEEAGKMITTDENVRSLWITIKSRLIANIHGLRDIISQIDTKFKNKDVTGLGVIWDVHTDLKEQVIKDLSAMKEFGNAIFVDEKLKEWSSIWLQIEKDLNGIASIVETYHLKLNMMESLKPEEIDDLTKDILKHIPMNYTDEEAYQYEKEYVQAYSELKESQSRKKNLWDKILDILAGGIQETPAHRVQMRRWMESNSQN